MPGAASGLPSWVKNLFHNQARVRRRRGGMQVEEESLQQYVDIARAPDKEMRPDRPVPSGVAARTVACGVTLLDNIDILPSSGALHTVRPGHNASRAWLCNRF